MMNEAKNPGHERWLKTLTEARENCREKLATGMVEVEDPTRAVWPSVARRSMGDEQLAAMHAHVAVIDYADLLEPCRDQAPNMWDEELDAVDIGSAYEAIEVSLEVLDQWESQTIQIQRESQDELYGSQTVTKSRRLLLPIESGRQCYRQMNRIVQRIGLGVNTGEIDGESAEPF